jgi:hypothetical protein
MPDCALAQGDVTFWNEGDPEAARGPFPGASFLRRHVLELPIHQDVAPDHVQYIADCTLEMLRSIPSPRLPRVGSAKRDARIA